MPFYNYKNKETGETEEHFLKISEKDDFLKENDHLEELLHTPRYADAVRLGVTKPDSSFTDVMKNIKKRYHKSTIEV